MESGFDGTRQGHFRRPSRRTLTVSIALLVAAIVIANLTTQESTVSGRIIINGALPWAFQVAAILTLFAGCSMATYRPAFFFTGCVVTSIGLTWWLGNIATYAGRDPIEAAVQTIETSIAQQIAGESLSFTLTHRVCGPLMSVFQLRGMLSLAGGTFGYSLCSLFIIMGYLFVTASVCNVGKGGRTRVRDCVKLFLMLLILFTPSLIRLAIDASSPSF